MEYPYIAKDTTVPYQTTVVFIPTFTEAAGLLATRAFYRPKGKTNLYFCHSAADLVCVCITGMGGRKASLTVRTYLSKNRVDRVIVAGFCGALSPLYKVGQLVTDENIIAAAMHPVLSNAARRKLLRQGFKAVDMETAAILGVVRSEFEISNVSVVRVVSDTAIDLSNTVHDRIGLPPITGFACRLFVTFTKLCSTLYHIVPNMKAAKDALSRSVLAELDLPTPP